MGRPFFTSVPHTSRFLYNIRCRLAVVLLIFAVIRIQHLYNVHRGSLVAKYSPTSFSLNSDDPYPQFRRPEDEDFGFRDELLADRSSWKTLGEGWEGKVFAYKSYVIKTFTPGRSPFRNCVPGSEGDRWPTEIPASLLFGHIPELSSRSNPVIPGPNRTFDNGLLPVVTYFKASPTPSEPEEWHLVTPFLAGGNLHTLSRSFKQDGERLTVQDLDAAYRPAFDRLLGSLAALHTAGYCHDDVKPANIFVRDESHWVLGDLGNLREVFHAYHSSHLWSDNNQLEDCRANDVVRALKSYVSFIRSSTADEMEFYVSFFQGGDPLSNFFWWSMSDAASMSAAELLRRSQIAHPTATSDALSGASTSLADGAQTFLKFFPRRLALRHTADAVLATRMGEKVARFWAMVWLFGVPSSKSCGV